jgi:hypothetical protein
LPFSNEDLNFRGDMSRQETENNGFALVSVGSSAANHLVNAENTISNRSSCVRFPHNQPFSHQEYGSGNERQFATHVKLTGKHIKTTVHM